LGEAWTEPESIGQRLRRLRLERNLSQRELSSPGVSYAYISRIEAGARRPSVKAIRQLARKLGVSAEYLETGSDLREVDERELRLADAELELRLGDDPEQAERLIQAVLDGAVAAGDTTTAVRARAALGLVAARAGRSAEAAESLEAAVDAGPLSPARRPDVFVALGQAYALLGDHRRAVELFERCLVQIEEEAPDDAAGQVHFATHLASALAELGNLDRAESVLHDALARADDGGDVLSSARRLWSLARAQERRGDLAAALECIRRAIALLEVNDDALHLGRAYLLCGTIMVAAGKAEEAGATLGSAERLLGPRSDPLDLANLRIMQAKRAAALQRPTEAQGLARDALALLGDDQPAERGVALGVLAAAMAQQGEPDADDAFKRAAKLLDGHGDRVERADTYRAWARYLRNAGRDSEALDVLDRAAQLAASTGA
jgi:tetratricopeptide (TPR) repeat protein